MSEIVTAIRAVAAGRHYVTLLLTDFHRADRGARDGEEAVVVGPTHAIDPAVRDGLDWLSAKTRVTLVDEGRMLQAPRGIRAKRRGALFERLHAGGPIYLRASVIPGDQRAALSWEAILSLSRAVFAAGRRLLVNADEAMAMYLALVAGEYFAVDMRMTTQLDSHPVVVLPPHDDSSEGNRLSLFESSRLILRADPER